MAGFKNIQIAATVELYDRFSELFMKSGLSSKAEFMRALLDAYENIVPVKNETVNNKDEINTAKLRAIELEYDDLKSENHQLKTQIEVLNGNEKDKDIKKLSKHLSLYNSLLQPLVNKVKGKSLFVGKRVFHVQNELEMLTLMVHTYKID